MKRGYGFAATGFEKNPPNPYLPPHPYCMKSPTRWNAELIVASVAVVIGILTMIVYIFQARIMNKQMLASAWPHLEVVTSTGSTGLALNVANKGIGPARVMKSEIRLDGKYYAEKQIDSVLKILLGRPVQRNFETVQGRVLAAGDQITFLGISNIQDAIALDSAVRKHDWDLEICYCSVYDDCWSIRRGQTSESDECIP